MEDKKTSKILVIVSIIIATILTGVGVAFGYFIWNSSSDTDVSLNVNGVVVELSDGKDITGANLMPVASYMVNNSNVIKKDIKVRLKSQSVNTVTVTMSLKINSIDSGLNHSSFKYNLVNASGTSVTSGNFATSKADDTISLLTLSTADGSLTTSLSSYTLYIYIDGASGDNPSSMQNQSFDFSLDVVGTNSTLERLTGASIIANLDDKTTGDEGSGVYKVSHSAIASGSSATGSEIKASDDYRFYGADPSNYICLDKEGESTCPDKHLYRIIGSIYEEIEKTNRLKVIKATPLTDGTTSNYTWDFTSNGSYNNIWATINSDSENYSNSDSSGSTLMQLLNSGAWWNGTNSSYYNSTNATTVDFTNYKLSDKAKSYISTSRYYLGGYNNNTFLTNIVYGYERGKTRYNKSRPLYWDGMVGLMYSSDYGYAAGNSCVTATTLNNYSGECHEKDWLYNSNYQWIISPYSGHSSIVFLVSSNGSVSYNTTSYLRSVRPVFYLASDVVITDGKGTYEEPYILS